MPYDFVLTDDEKRELLRIARTTLREYFYSGRIPPGKPHRDSLIAHAGAFVSLHNKEALRGCIGMPHEDKALFRAVQEMAIAAATRDPRFVAVTEGELDDVVIEISVLGGYRDMQRSSDVAVGTHGLTIEKGDRRGLLLPQVATKHEWNAEEFLAQVCVKAGLPRDAWSAGDVQIALFTAQVFDDTSHPPLLGRFR